MAPHNEQTLQMSAPLPNSYRLVTKGYAYLTRKCRAETHAAGQTVYRVLQGKTPVGIAIPSRIYSACLAEESSTRATRRTALQAKDAAEQATAAALTRKMYPRMPPEHVARVVEHAFAKRSGRVGRVGGLELEDKVRAAVIAFARHRMTSYDALLREGVDREKARAGITAEVGLWLRVWQGKIWETEANSTMSSGTWSLGMKKDAGKENGCAGKENKVVEQQSKIIRKNHDAVAEENQQVAKKGPVTRMSSRSTKSQRKPNCVSKALPTKPTPGILKTNSSFAGSKRKPGRVAKSVRWTSVR